MRSEEAHVLESIANPTLPTLQIVEYRGETTASAPTESAPAAGSVPSAHPGRYTLRTIPQSAPPAPSTQLASAAPTLRAAVNGYGFEENTDASAQRHAQTPQVAAALRNVPGLAKLHAVTRESTDSANQLCLWYEPLDSSPPLGATTHAPQQPCSGKPPAGTRRNPPPPAYLSHCAWIHWA